MIWLMTIYITRVAPELADLDAVDHAKVHAVDHATPVAVVDVINPADNIIKALALDLALDLALALDLEDVVRIALVIADLVVLKSRLGFMVMVQDAQVDVAIHVLETDGHL